MASPASPTPIKYLIGVKYTPGDPWTDFERMIRKANNPSDPDFDLLQDSLFIYNENSSQYFSNSITPGGGNACIRPWRVDVSKNNGKYYVYSLGIPTDDVELSHYAIAQVILFLNANPQINKVFWSSEKGQLGLGIFAHLESAQIVSATFPRLLINMTIPLGFNDVYYLDKEYVEYDVKLRNKQGGYCFSDLPKFLNEQQVGIKKN